MLNVDILFSLLEKRNIKQADLSKATGISTGNISDWKKGKSFPSAEKLVLIAEYLGCSTDYLLGRTDNPNISGNTQFNGENHNGIQATVNTGNLTVNENTKIDTDTDELVNLIKSLPLVKRAEAVIYLNELKTKNSPKSSEDKKG